MGKLEWQLRVVFPLVIADDPVIVWFIEKRDKPNAFVIGLIMQMTGQL